MIKQVENNHSGRRRWGLRWQGGFEKYLRGKLAIVTVSTYSISFVEMEASFVCTFDLPKKILNFLYINPIFWSVGAPLSC